MLKDFATAIEQNKINNALISHYRAVIKSQEDLIEKLLIMIDKYQYESLNKETNEREEA